MAGIEDSKTTTSTTPDSLEPAGSDRGMAESRTGVQKVQTKDGTEMCMNTQLALKRLVCVAKVSRDSNCTCARSYTAGDYTLAASLNGNNNASPVNVAPEVDMVEDIVVGVKAEAEEGFGDFEKLVSGEAVVCCMKQNKNHQEKQGKAPAFHKK